MIHDLLPLARYAELPTGAELSVWGRTAWTFRAYLSRPATIDPAASIVIESSPRAGDDADWREVATLALADTAEVVSATATLGVTEHYLRARPTGAGLAGATYSVQAEAAFVLTTGADVDLFGKELRSWSDGFARTLAEAERAVFRLCTVRPVSSSALGALAAPPAPYVDYAFDSPGAVDALRSAIVAQCEHLFRRYRLTQTNDPTAAVTLRQYSDVASVVPALLSPFRSSSIDAWMGR